MQRTVIRCGVASSASAPTPSTTTTTGRLPPSRTAQSTSASLHTGPTICTWGSKEVQPSDGGVGSYLLTVPEGSLGGGVWTSVAVTPTAVFASTGSADPGVEADACSIIRLDASTLAREGGWRVPPSERVHDSDFRSSQID